MDFFFYIIKETGRVREFKEEASFFSAQKKNAHSLWVKNETVTSSGY